MQLEKVYQEKVYAGVLGKIIGVYLGRPVENWSHELIMEQVGPINYYVNEKLKVPLVVTDDDITGTFTFIRALADYGNNSKITAKQIGQTWINNIIERETILWWGGVGNSSEHTAYQNLKNGISAPESGSAEFNGKVIAEQIGSQIFIDGWAMVSPGDPEKAASLAKRAASVSHDGEAIYGAQVIAALEAQAFVEKDINKLIEVAKNLIPKDSTIYKLISDIQDWRAGDNNWEKARKKIVENYGYDKFLGNCHIVPNHALIIMSLLYGNDNFQKTLMIVNTAGWDTDCNSGNVGCILGIKGGLEAIDKDCDWRSPIKDLMYCPTANGGQTMTDALTESYKIINITRAMNAKDIIRPKNGARYHFEMPGAVQGWKAENTKNLYAATVIKNIEGHSREGSRSLEIAYKNVCNGLDSIIYADVFFPEEIKNLEGNAKKIFFHYNFISCPLIYSGQIIKASIKGDVNIKPVFCRLFVKYYGKQDELITVNSEKQLIQPNNNVEFNWQIDIDDGNPITQIGIKIESDEITSGKIYLDYVGINGNPKISFIRPSHVSLFERGKFLKNKPAEMWRNSWVKAVDHWETGWKETFRISNNNGRGMIITGTPDWKDYTVSSIISFELVKSGGIAARVQGLQRYYSLELSSKNKISLIKMLDGINILAEFDCKLEFQKSYNLCLKVEGDKLTGYLNRKLIFEYHDKTNPLYHGGIGLVVESGTQSTSKITVS